MPVKRWLLPAARDHGHSGTLRETLTHARSRNITLTVSAILIAGTLTGAAGAIRQRNRPITRNATCSRRTKGKPQRENTFFEDGRVMRPLEEGTVSASAPVVETAYHRQRRTRPCGRQVPVGSHGR